MLNAEHVALESRLVQQMVALRQREMDALLNRFTAVGTQASLLAGFAIGVLAGGPSPSDPDVAVPVRYIFYISSLTCVLCSMHVVACTMYVCNWAPGLALRGPSGSLTRAYEASRSERKQINLFFTLAIIAFAVQMVALVFILDGSNHITVHAAYATVITVAAVLADLFYHYRIHQRFYGDAASGGCLAWFSKSNTPVGKAGVSRVRGSIQDGGTGSGSAPLTARLLSAPAASNTGGSSATTAADGASTNGGESGTAARRHSTSLLANPLIAIGDNADAATPHAAVALGGGQATRSELCMAGTLSKRSVQPGDRASSSATGAALRRFRQTVAGEWRDRFFVLRNGTLNYWRSEADYDANKPPELDNPIALNGHEVLVDTEDVRWGFALQPVVNDGRRTWHLRAPTEEFRHEWAKKLVLNTMMAGPSDN